MGTVMTAEQQINIWAKETTEHISDKHKATAVIVQRLIASPALLKEYLHELVLIAVITCLEHTKRDANRELFRAAKAEEATQAAVTILLMDVVLGDGTQLARATRPKLLAESLFFEKQARTMGMKAGFFQRVADQLLDDESTVADRLTEEQLRECFKQAKAATRETLLDAVSRSHADDTATEPCHDADSGGPNQMAQPNGQKRVGRSAAARRTARTPRGQPKASPQRAHV